jgi:hypothetical protein
MTDRTLDADLQAGSASAVFNYVIFVKLAFPSGTVYVHNGVGTYSFGGDDYLGVGGFGSIDALEETLSLNSRPVSLTLSSITPEIIDAVKTDDVFGRDADIYLGALNEHGELQGTPDNWFSGHMENVELNLGSTDGLKIRIQSRASRLRLRNNKRYTLEDHQKDYPGDLFFEFLPALQDAQVIWGGEQVRTGFTNADGLGNDGNGGGGGGRPRPPARGEFQ